MDRDNDTRDYGVQVCFGRNCTPAGARAVLAAMEREIAVQGLKERVTVLPSSCRNRCDFGPSVNVMPPMQPEAPETQDIVQYARVNAEAARCIVREHLKDGRPVAAYLFHPPAPHPFTNGKRAFTYDPAAFRPRDDDR